MPPGSARDSLQRELDLVQFRYDKTNPIPGQESRKNTYLNRAYKALQFYDGEADVELTQFDLKGSVATVRTLTSVAYLGGSFASGVLNILTLFSNTLPYLATYNNKRAFGGGFGWGQTQSALTTAMGTMFSRKFVNPKVITRSGKPEDDPNNAAFYEAIAAKFKDGDAKLLAGGKIDYYQKKDGLTRDEANFLAQEIREGKMIPAISNMVMYSARGMPEFLSRGAKYIDAYMSFFNQTEQYARRAAGLAAYRLHRDRAFAEAKIDPNKPESAAALAEIQENARNFAAESLDLTVGEYSTMNRPPMFRGSLLGLTYTFKAFPTTMTLLMRNLPKSGQAAMILALWTAGGLTALPFAEDLEDIADTLGQRLGIYKAFGIGGSGRKALEELAAKELGLFGKILTRGAFRYIPVVGSSADVGSRLSLGNQMPLTTVALQGSTSLERDIIDALGPVVTFSIDSVKSAGALTAESFRFVNGEPTEFSRVLRESPVTAMRYASDIYTYQATGAVTDKKGAVVSREGLTGAMFARALGFYPQVAADANTFIKLAQRDRQFHRQMSSSMRDRWIRANLQGNLDDAATIEAWVNEWNAQNPDRAINNFRRNAQRGLKEWRKIGRDRFIASSPVALRRSFEEFSQLYDDDE
ncbi:MAG: PLxRFG domain-containing protein [Acidimicrobiales bacterium]